jgi:hypothetical protein
MNLVTICNPRAAHRIEAIAGAARPATLKNLVVGFVDNSKQNADHFIERVGALLREQCGIVDSVRVRKHAPKDELAEGDLAALAKCAAVVQCYGD